MSHCIYIQRAEETRDSPTLDMCAPLFPFPVATHGAQHHDQEAAIAESSCIGEDRDWASASDVLYSDAPMHV